MNILLVVVSVVFSIVAFVFPLRILYYLIPRSTWFCRELGWHDGKGKSEHNFDGCSFHSICSRCKKEVMLDSQGNWF